jgi:UDP-3-O-[3-hydroxymyristoyl] glucosamine N-acyltransferase
MRHCLKNHKNEDLCSEDTNILESPNHNLNLNGNKCADSLSSSQSNLIINKRPHHHESHTNDQVLCSTENHSTFESTEDLFDHDKDQEISNDGTGKRQKCLLIKTCGHERMMIDYPKEGTDLVERLVHINKSSLCYREDFE